MYDNFKLEGFKGRDIIMWKTTTISQLSRYIRRFRTFNVQYLSSKVFTKNIWFQKIDGY